MFSDDRALEDSSYLVRRVAKKRKRLVVDTFISLSTVISSAAKNSAGISPFAAI